MSDNKKSLWIDYRNRSKEATSVELETEQALEPVVARYIAMGYSPREISHLMMHCVIMLEMKHVAKLPKKEG